MDWTKLSFVVIACFTISFATGCVGPRACGPGGACGPLAMNSCDGCSDCEGCGELYIDPWINEPANCVDPCDQCGNYNGQSCGKCRSVFSGFASMWGYRRDAGCGSCGSVGCDGGCGPVSCAPVSCGCESSACDGGCGFIEPNCGCDDSCGGCSSCSGDGIHYLSSEPVHSMPMVQSEPTMAPEPAFVPERTRKIFRPKGNLANEPSSLR